jgi:putative transposase
VSADLKVPTQILTYKCRLTPTKAQYRALESILEDQRILYNAALQERVDCYRHTEKGRSYVDQCKALTECRHDLPNMGALPVCLQRWTLKRVDDAFTGFFGRVKRGERAGFPRFRGRGRWDSFGFSEFSGIRFDGKRLRFAGIPHDLRVNLHRLLPLGANIRSCVFCRDGRVWRVCFQISVALPEPSPSEIAIGIDLGLKAFSYASDGVIISAPQIGRRYEKELRRKNRALARCKRGSKRRSKVKARLVRVHRKVADARSTWLHQQSRALVDRADTVIAEDLNIRGMVRHPTLARSIADASWAKFVKMVSYKAACAGGKLILVNPKNTSQRCSGCNELVPKSLALRTHSCPHCGLTIDRDHNASLNILAAGIGRGQLNAGHWPERAAGNMCVGP